MAFQTDHPLETAFPETMGDLADMAKGMTLNRQSLSATIKLCDLAQCRGTCCHDGAYLSSEEALVIRELVNSERDGFLELGIDLPEQPVVFGSWRGVASGPKTATRSAPMRQWVSDYPQHFPETNCVFLHSKSARCGLQLLAEERGLPKWYYKPGTCWMHPLSIEKDGDGKPSLTLHSEETDPQRFPDYDGFVCRTLCGRTCEEEGEGEGEGEPAIEVLREEIERVMNREI